MDTTTITYIGSIIGISFLGSWHCALMCGPIAAQIGYSGKTLYYQMGRMLSYSLMGGAFGAAGEILLKSSHRWIVLSTILLFSMIIMTSGLNRMGLLEKHWKSLFQWLNQAEGKIKKVLFAHFSFKPGSSSLLAGLLTGWLPCGWLFTFYSAASLSKSSLGGAVVMFCFWLGSLPSLLTVSEFLRQSLLRTSARQQRISGLLLIASGLYALVSHLIVSGILS